MLNCSNVPKMIQSLCKVKDIENNTQASDYFNDNYLDILESAQRMTYGSRDNILWQDVVNDVYISILKAESVGCGYNVNLGLSVEQFIFGRIKGYMKNPKYRVLGESKVQEGVAYSVMSAYASEELQYAYENALDLNSSECYSLLDDVMDIEEELKTCLKGSLVHNVNLRVLIESPEKFKDAGSAAKKVLKMLKDKLDKDTLESLRIVMEYDNRSVIKDLLDKVWNDVNEDGAFISSLMGA